MIVSYSDADGMQEVLFDPSMLKRNSFPESDPPLAELYLERECVGEHKETWILTSPLPVDLIDYLQKATIVAFKRGDAEFDLDLHANEFIETQRQNHYPENFDIVTLMEKIERAYTERALNQE